MSEPVTIYVTKDAPTRGIVQAPYLFGGCCPEGYARPAPTEANPRGTGPWLAPASYRMTLPEAIADAERRRARKIASLENQLAKVRAMDLTKPVGESPSTMEG